MVIGTFSEGGSDTLFLKVFWHSFSLMMYFTAKMLRHPKSCMYMHKMLLFLILVKNTIFFAKVAALSIPSIVQKPDVKVIQAFRIF